MISLPERSSVWVSGLSAPGAAGSGICFTQTTTFMADHLCGPGPSPAIRPVHGAFLGAQFPPPPGPARASMAVGGPVGPTATRRRNHPADGPGPPALLVERRCGRGEGVAEAVGDDGVDAEGDHGGEVGRAR